VVLKRETGKAGAAEPLTVDNFVRADFVVFITPNTAVYRVTAVITAILGLEKTAPVFTIVVAPAIHFAAVVAVGPVVSSNDQTRQI